MAEKNRVSRRRFLSTGALAGSAALLPPAPAAARSYRDEVPWQAGQASAPESPPAGGYQFFTADEAAFMEAAVDRLIPADELGPGAKQAGVAIFIDRQLLGAYGAAQTWYMQGPWADGQETQGYQSRLTPAQLYRAAIKAIDDHCRKSFSGRAFAALEAAQQDEVLGGLEKGKIELANVKAKAFFTLLLQNTIEGFFSDPLYGGNRDMIGWKLIGFPGARYDYRPYVAKHNQRLALDPVGIMGRPGWSSSG
jgi:gluconate 2-dehydrogenase gamma chain